MPSCKVVFNQTGVDFVTEISFCMKTLVVHEKRLVFRGWKSAREIIEGICINHGVYTASNTLS